MAKKKTARRRSPAKPIANVPPGQSLGLPSQVELVHTTPVEEQHREDAAAIVLAKAEEMMTRKKEECLELRKDTIARAEKLHEEANDLAKKQADEYAKEAGEALKGSELANLLQLPKTTRCCATYGLPGRDAKTKRWGKMPVSLAFGASGPRGEVSINRTISVAADPEITKRLANWEKLNTLAGEQHAEAMGWQRKLAQMNRLERATRSDLAERKLRGSEEGAELLEHLLGRMDDNIAALPGAG